MNAMDVLFVMLGVGAGVIQASLLRRSAGAVGSPLGFVARFVIVGGVLVGSALAGSLLPGVLGWAVGFAAALVTFARRMR